MDNINWKKILAVLGFVVLVVLLAYGLYALFFQPSPAPPTNAPGVNQPPTNGLPSAGTGTPGQVTNVPGGLPGGQAPGGAPTPSATADGGLTETDVLVNGSTLGTAGDGSAVVYYQPSDGKFYRTLADGTTTALSDQVFHNVQQITWSPDRKEAVLEYPDGANVIYNFSTKKQDTLPKHWEDFSFNPAGDKLAFKSLGLDINSRWLGISSANGDEPTAIQALGNNADSVNVQWSPNKQVVATFREHTGADRQEIFFVGLHGENFKSMTAPGLGFQSSWSPDGQRLLYSVSSGNSAYKPQLWIADAAGDNIGENRQNIGLNTWADKCTFTATTNLICAVPNNLPDGAGLAPSLAASNPDTFYRVNTATGQTQVLAAPTTNVSATNLTTSTDGRWLFFQDSSSGKVYKIALY